MSAVRHANFKDRFLEVQVGRQSGDGYQKLSCEFSFWPSAMGWFQSLSRRDNIIASDRSQAWIQPVDATH